MRYAVSILAFWLVTLTAQATIQVSFKTRVDNTAEKVGDLIDLKGVDPKTRQRIDNLVIPSRLVPGMIISRTRMTYWLSQLLNRPNLPIQWSGPKKITIDKPQSATAQVGNDNSQFRQTRDDAKRSMVQVGDDISIQVNHGAIHLRVSGIARQTGKKGDVIDVENQSSHQTFKARVIGDKSVEVVQ